MTRHKRTKTTRRGRSANPVNSMNLPTATARMTQTRMPVKRARSSRNKTRRERHTTKITADHAPRTKRNTKMLNTNAAKKREIPAKHTPAPQTGPGKVVYRVLKTPKEHCNRCAVSGQSPENVLKMERRYASLQTPTTTRQSSVSLQRTQGTRNNM